MPVGDESRGHSVTDTSRTLSTGDAGVGGRHVPVLAIVLEADRPHAGAWVTSVDGVTTVEIVRGKERRAERRGDLLVVHVPDRHLSRPHVRLDLAGGHDPSRAAAVRDLGSSNGTFVRQVAGPGGRGGEEQVRATSLASGQVLRVGHTFVTLLADGAALLERARLGAPWPFTTLSPAFARDLVRLERVASSTLPVLLLGETGTGKEVLAQAIHDRSGRPGRLVAVNCGALPATLVEAQLFGHVKGSFSGALRDEVGFVRSAQHGTLFLDEIGDLPLAAQASLLRVLQEGEVTPVGAFAPVKVDVRLVSATHKDLAAAEARGEFRADLLARIAGFTFAVPPLRDRRLDLGALIAALPPRDGAPLALRPDAAWALLEHDYPMNVRELRHALESAGVLADGPAIRADDLPAAMRGTREPAPSNAVDGTGSPTTGADSLDEEDRVLRAELVRQFEAHGGNLSQVARTMGKARQQIQRWVKRFGLER